MLLPAPFVYLLLLLLFPVAAHADDLLSIGDEAPPLHIAGWVSSPPAAEQEKQVSVILFWATWSPESRQALGYINSLPVLSEQKNIRVLALSGEPCGRVRTFLKKHSDDYPHLAFACDNRQETRTAYAFNAGEVDLPVAVIIDGENHVAWIGHPLDGLQQALTHILDHDWDLKVNRHARDLLLEARQAAADENMQELLKTTAKLTWISDVYASFGVYHYTLLAGENRSAEALQFGNKLVSRYPTRPDVLRALAAYIVKQEKHAPGELDLALSAAEKAASQVPDDDLSMIQLLAEVHFARKEYAAAVELQEKLCELAENRLPRSEADKCRKTLSRYRRVRARAEKEESRNVAPGGDDG